MSQKEDSNDVLSWLERRKKKQSQSREKLVPEMLNGVISTINQSDKNESTSFTTRYVYKELARCELGR